MYSIDVYWQEIWKVFQRSVACLLLIYIFCLFSVLWSSLSLSSMHTRVCIHLGGVGLKSCNPLSPFIGCKKIFFFIPIRTEFSSLEFIINYENHMGPILIFHVLSVPLVTWVRGMVLCLNYEMLGSSPLTCLSVFKALLRKLLALGLFPTRR